MTRALLRPRSGRNLSRKALMNFSRFRALLRVAMLGLNLWPFPCYSCNHGFELRKGRSLH